MFDEATAIKLHKYEWIETKVKSILIK